MGDVTNCLIFAGIFLVLGLGLSLLKAATAGRRKLRAAARDALAVPSAAKILAAEPGSRLNTHDWTDILFDLHRAGFRLDESLALVKRVRTFWKRPA